MYPLRKFGILAAAAVVLGGAFLVHRLRRSSAPEAPSRERVVRISDTQAVFHPSEKKGIGADPASFYRQFRLTPRFTDKDADRVDGVDVSFVSPDSCLFLGGLRQGDHVTEVDAERVERVDQVMNLAHRITTRSKLSLGVVRQGKRIPLVLEFR